MERITSNQVVGLMEAYNQVYTPQVNEDYLWESYLTEEFISEAYQTVADYLVYNGFVPGYNTAEVYMSEMAVEDIDSILFETGVLNEQYLLEAGFFQNAANSVIGGVKRAGSAVAGGVRSVAGGADRAVGGAVRAGQTAVGAVKRAGNSVAGGVQRAGQTAVGAVKRAGSAVSGATQRAGAAVQRAVTPVAQAVKGTAQRAVSAGQSALGGAARAVQGAGQAVVGGAQRAASAVGGAAAAAGRKIGQEIEISRKVGAGEPLKPSMPKLPSSAAQPGAGPVGNKVGSTPSRFAGARDKAFSAAQGIKGSPVVGPKTATPAPAARPATPAPSAAKPATAPAAKPATPAATTGNPPLRPPALPPITGKPSLRSGIDDLKKMGDASRQRQASMLNQSFDIFDTIKGHLIDEGYADTEEAALQIMANMSEEWRQSIVSEVFPAIDAVKGVAKKIGNYLNSPSNDTDIKRDPSYNPKTGKGDYKDPRKSSPRPGEVRTY